MDAMGLVVIRISDTITGRRKILTSNRERIGRREGRVAVLKREGTTTDSRIQAGLRRRRVRTRMRPEMGKLEELSRSTGIRYGSLQQYGPNRASDTRVPPCLSDYVACSQRAAHDRSGIPMTEVAGES